jgi:hypothetical protein
MAAALTAEPQIARPVDPPRGHSRPGKALGVTWEIAVTLGATVATGDSPEAERLAAHRWAWLARDPAWKQLFETAVAAKLADHLVVALPEERHVPLCAEGKKSSAFAPPLLRVLNLFPLDITRREIIRRGAH